MKKIIFFLNFSKQVYFRKQIQNKLKQVCTLVRVYQWLIQGAKRLT
jgi:hypothetical protein